MRQLNAACLAALIVAGASCIFGDEEQETYDVQYRKVVPGQVLELIDNGWESGSYPDVVLTPRVYSEDGFYLVESYEMLDSLFWEFSYPGIDTLFPEDGMLLILHFDNSWKKDVVDYGYSFSGDTVIVDMTVYDVEGPTNPIIVNFIFPIGLVLR